MNVRIFYIWLCMLLANASIICDKGVVRCFNGYTRIDCALKPILRASRQDRTRSNHKHSTRPHIPIKRR